MNGPGIERERFESAKELQKLSAEAIMVAQKFDAASEYGKAIIRCVLQQEQKNHELKSSLERYLAELK